MMCVGGKIIWCMVVGRITSRSLSDMTYIFVPNPHASPFVTVPATQRLSGDEAVQQEQGQPVDVGDAEVAEIAELVGGSFEMVRAAVRAVEKRLRLSAAFNDFDESESSRAKGSSWLGGLG
jgi:hypothetical protein